MKGFRPAVDGYYDVTDQLPRYLQHRAAVEFERSREAKRAIDTRNEFERRRERLCERFLDRIGGLPDRPTDIVTETTGTIEREGYTVERVTVESLPDFHVTANCYVPGDAGPHPSVLFLCGHVTAAKADPLNQRACIELALNGFVVCVVDPVCQGERTQYRDIETGGPLVGSAGGAFAHCYAGQQCLYAGANLTRFMLHDARCALDYLSDRPDVDDDRLGVTGTSGGGVQAQYLALVDDRLAAAAPCCSVTTREEWLKTGKRIDAEQLLPGAIPQGIDYDDFLGAMAPRPVCVGAATSDQYFPIEGVHEAVERTRRVYDLYDTPENVECVVADERHCSVYELGDGVFEFFCDRLGDGEYESHDDSTVLDETNLDCTPDGCVQSAYPDERTVADLVREFVSERVPNAGAGTTANDADGELRLRRTLLERFDLDRTRTELHPRYIEENEQAGLTVEHVWFRTERAPDIVVTGVVVSHPDVATECPAVVCYENGTDELPERSDDVAELAAEYGTVLVFDPRGVGAVRNREIPIPNWVEDYHGIYGTEFKLAYDALLLGVPLFGMRVFDVLRAVEFLRGETDCSAVSLVGDGVGAYHALYAAAVEEHVTAVDLRALDPSFREMATSREYPYDARLTVFDVLDCDVPRLLAVLDERNVTLTVERASEGCSE